MKNLNFLFSILFVTIFITGCEKDNINPINPNNGKYKNGVIIRNDYKNSANGIDNVNTITLKPSGLKLKSTGDVYTIQVEDLDGIINIMKSYGCDSMSFTNPAYMLNVNNNYVLIKGHDNNDVKIFMSFPIYNDVTRLDSISIDSITNNTYIYRYSDLYNNKYKDTIHVYNMIDTVNVNDINMVKFYDTIMVQTDADVVDKSYSGILFNVSTGKYFGMDYNFSISNGSLTYYKNNPLYLNNDEDKFYIYDNIKMKILECNLSSDKPTIYDKYSINSNISEEVGQFYILNNGFIFKSPSSGHYISVSNNNVIDMIDISSILPNTVNDCSILSDGNTVDFFIPGNYDTVNVYKMSLINDSISISHSNYKVTLNNYGMEDVFHWVHPDMRTTTYSFKDNNTNLFYYYESKFENINVFSPSDNKYLSYPITGFVDHNGLGGNIYGSDMDYNDITKVKKIDDNFIIYSLGHLYKVNITNLTNLVADEYSNMSDIFINTMTVDSNNLVVFYGYKKGVGFVNGKLNPVTGEVTDYTISSTDNSEVIITSLSLN